MPGLEIKGFARDMKSVERVLSTALYSKRKTRSLALEAPWGAESLSKTTNNLQLTIFQLPRRQIADAVPIFSCRSPTSKVIKIVLNLRPKQERYAGLMPKNIFHLHLVIYKI